MTDLIDADDIIDTLNENHGIAKRLAKKKTKAELPAASEVLVDLALGRAMDDAMQERLSSGMSKGLLVDVPDGGWSNAVALALIDLFDDAPYAVARSQIPAQRDLDDANLPRHLREGRLAIGVAPQAERALPPLLVAVADERIKLPPAGADLVAQVIARCQGGTVPLTASELKTEILSFDELCSIIVPGAKPIDTVARLAAAIQKKIAPRAGKLLPKLEDAIEYGQARLWALGLRDDIADLRKGLIEWGDIDVGCVLFGESGTGKTLLAQMLGESIGIPTVVSSIGELFATSSGYLDGVIKALRKVFDEARSKAPCILFLDELNALPNVDTVGDKNRDYWVPVILDFYQLLDGAMSDRSGVIVIGATNRILDINPALLRPGRLERAIHVGPPDKAGVERILRHHLGSDLAGQDLGMIVALNAGRRATGAVLMEQVRAARRLARRAGRPMIVSDLEAQVIGDDFRSEEAIRRSAVHEAGHVIAGLEIGGTLESVSIIATGDSGGSASFEHPLDKLHTGVELQGLAMSMLAGRAAEQIILGEPSSGAGGGDDSDLGRATDLVARMEGSLGLGDSLVFRAGPGSATSLLLEVDFRRRVDKAMSDLYQRALNLIRARKPALLAVADALAERRFLSGKDVAEIIQASEGATLRPDVGSTSGEPAP